MFFEKYPNTDFHELNLDWLIAKMKELDIKFDEFKVVNNITFSGQWDITKQYPAWTIVNDNNIGYVSIQPVPAGIVLTNTDYWAAVIDYSAQIAGLQNRVVALENRCDGYDTHFTTIDNNLTALNNLVFKKYLFVSDSYGATVVPKVVNMLGLSASDYVSVQQGGSGFGPLPTDPLNWEYMISNAAISDKETFTDVVYIGGANEASYTDANIRSHAISCYDYVAANFVNAKQHYMFAGYYADLGIGDYGLTGRYRLLRRMPGLIAETGRAFTINECWYPLTLESNVGLDHIHPTNNGAEAIAQIIANCLNGGEAYFSIPPTEITVSSSVNTINACQFNLSRVNKTVRGTIRALDVTLANSINIGTTGIDVVLGTIPNNIIRGGTFLSPGLNCDLDLGDCYCITNGNHCNGKLFLTPNNEIKVHLWSANAIMNTSHVQIVYKTFEVSNYMN